MPLFLYSPYKAKGVEFYWQYCIDYWYSYYLCSIYTIIINVYRCFDGIEQLIKVKQHNNYNIVLCDIIMLHFFMIFVRNIFEIAR